ncbi:unnamed protein product [Gulo gulo]|uniref:Uncharacterized protein n=1 Tax=Gulo gulo TaxID=48420 RepID=A0A9X9M5B4_GULGU|nr:unnamed protein product [Gulo gulo]
MINQKRRTAGTFPTRLPAQVTQVLPSITLIPLKGDPQHNLLLPACSQGVPQPLPQPNVATLVQSHGLVWTPTFQDPPNGKIQVPNESRPSGPGLRLG